MKNVVIIHGQLTHGGSERQLYSFLKFCERKSYCPHLLISGELGYWKEPIQKLDIPIKLLTGSRIEKMRQLRRYCFQNDADTLLSWSAYTNVYSWALVGSRIKCVGSFRNAKYTDLPKRLNTFWRWACVKRLSTLICNSQETHDSLLGDIQKWQHLVYIPNGVEPVENSDLHRAQWRSKLKVSEHDILIVGIGRLAVQKNFHRFIETISIASESYPCKAVIAGPDKGEKESLQQLISQLQLSEEQVRLIGEIPDARELICAADIFFLSSDFEGMPNVVMEAMAAEVPCLTTKVNGIDALMKHGIHGWIEERTVKDLAKALVVLCHDSELRTNLASNAKEHVVCNYAPEPLAKKIWSLC